jgi:hypothetical protein
MLTKLTFIETALTETQSKASSSTDADDSSRRIIVVIASGKGKQHKEDIHDDRLGREERCR